MGIFTLTLAEVIELHGRDNLGLDTYPVVSEKHRERLNGLIIDHYLNREIGQETVSLWRHAMRRKMNEIMPTFNRLYETDTLIVDPLRTVDIRTLTTSDSSETASSDTDTTSAGRSEQNAVSGSNSRQVGSDTPQVFLSGEGNYATNANDGNSQATANSSNTENGTSTTEAESNRVGRDVMDSMVSGFQGSQAELLLAYRATIMNIDMMVVESLERLFMGVWNNGDSYFDRRF